MTAEPQVTMVIRDESGAPVRRFPVEASAGLHRVSWDLRSTPPEPVILSEPEFRAPWERELPGPLVAPGRYSAELTVSTSDGVHQLTDRRWFTVQPIPAVATDLDGSAHRFGAETAELVRHTAGAKAAVDRQRDRITQLRATLTRTADAGPALVTRLETAHRRLEELRRELAGDPVRQRLAEADVPSIAGAAERVANFDWRTTAGPTHTQIETVERARAEINEWRLRLDEVIVELDSVAADLDSAGGTWTHR